MSLALAHHDGRLRPLLADDAAALAQAANERDIWLNLRDAFPYPYTVDDAVGFIAHVRNQPPLSALAIEIGGRVVGVIGATRGTDIQCVGAEVGYWLGRDAWGRGIASAALAAYRDRVMADWQLTRLFALPFADNLASCRVLEKCGFVRECVTVASARKNGVIKDQVLYACVAGRQAPDAPSYG